MHRLFGLALAAFAVVALASLAQAADKKDKGGEHGTFVSASGGKITIKQKEGEKTFDLAADVKVTGAATKLEDLKAKEPVSLTVTDGKVTEIHAHEKKPK